MARPSGEKVEIEFTPGVWTDVSADVRGSRVSVKYGRTTEFTDAGIAELNLELDDLAGNYTVRNTASPYYPNVQPRKRIRWSIQSGAVVLFTGYIKGWPPRFDGRQRYVPITAVDRMELLAKIDLTATPKVEVSALAPTVLIPFDDEDGSTTVGTYAGESLTVGYLGASGGSLTFGTTVPGAEYLGPVASFKGHVTGSACDGGAFVRIPAKYWTSATAWSFAITLRVDMSAAAAIQQLVATKAAGSIAPLFQIYLDSTGLGTQVGWLATGVADPAQRSLRDGAVHTIAVTYDGTNVRLYIDGALANTASPGALGIKATDLLVGGSSSPYSAWSALAQIGYVGWWDGVTLSAAQVTRYDTACRTGYVGELSGDRVKRILSYGGIDWTTDASVAAGVQTMGAADLAGKNVAEALQEVALAEGGGSVVYVRPDGKVTFLDRTFRNPGGSPIMTIDAEADLDGDSFLPDYDEALIVNDVTVTRPGGIPQRYVDAASVAAFTTTTDTFEAPCQTDLAALGLAQERVARFAWPTLRIPSLAVDMVTATTAGLYAALANLAIGARVRLSGITTTRSGAVVFPLGQLDQYVEGWSIDADADTFDLQMDVTAADAPARGVWDQATYGRWQPDPGSMTLQSAITSSGTTVVVVTAGTSPTLSTTAGDYPQQIRIDEEVLTVSAAPASGTSPQTLTVTRGQAGTIAAAHAAGAAISLYPQSTWTL